ncbi:MAG TPA: YbhB/YbcL family Raf kinase inhibitor-like protein [Beijerinckiaceae bacterium]|nr:YbhB/YbcL family Raf kinase inhibitor-like protein [Beijerinckiaceae bacterium]
MMSSRIANALPIVGLAFALTAGATSTLAQTPAAAAGFTLTSPKLTDGSALDKHYAGMNDARAQCGGDGVSLPLQWSNAPAKTQSFAVMLFDMDGGANGGVVHWIAYGIAPNVTALAEGDGNAPSQKMVGGSNTRGIGTYVGPCAPSADKPHHYIYTVYALDVPKGELSAGLTRDEFFAKVKGRILNAMSLVALYKRP